MTTTNETTLAEIYGITLKSVRRVREFVTRINQGWIASPKADLYSAYDAEAGIESNASKYRRQQGNLNTLDAVVRQEFADAIGDYDLAYDLIVNNQGRTIGIWCELLDIFEADMGMVRPLEAQARMYRPEYGSCDETQAEIWEAAYYEYAHTALRGPYNSPNTDWSQMTAADWGRVLRRADEAAGIAR